MASKNQSRTRKFVADGVFYSELNELLTRVLGVNGYAGVEIRVTPIRTEVIVRATRTREVLGVKGRRIRELTALVQKRFGFRDNSVELFAEQVQNRGCCAMAQAESLRHKLGEGLPVRRACYAVMNFVMRNGATGCEVIVSGKLRAQRAKVMKFRDGYLISTGEPKQHYVQEAVRHVLMRQGVLGVKVRIMLSYDPEGKTGTSKMMPDKVQVHEPKEEEVHLAVGDEQDMYGTGEVQQDQEIVDDQGQQGQQQYVNEYDQGVQHHQESYDQGAHQQHYVEEHQQHMPVEQNTQQYDNSGYNNYNNNNDQGGW